jgi:fatty acid desaturase
MFMCINVFCVCLNYAHCAYKINQVARAFFKESGILNQVDLKMANMITKKFKVKTSFEYLKIRQRIWKFQMILLVVVSIIGFPTTLIQKIRRKELHLSDTKDASAIPEETLTKLIDGLDWYIFIAFLGGFYKDVATHVNGTPSYQDYYYFPMAAMFFGLIIEKQAINWLTNRHGCTYFKLQKFIELDTRC